MNVFAVFALFIAVPSIYAGIVDHTRCGGDGTCHLIRIDGCEGAVANMTPGTPYPCHIELTPASAAAQLRLRVTVIYLGFPVSIINQLLPNSSVQPGVRFIATFTITPNDILSGNCLPIRVEISNEASGRVECCIQIQACA